MNNPFGELNTGDLLLGGKNAVIYGGGGAIGGAVARVFAREGARVFIAGRTQAKLDAVASDIAASGGTVETAQVDVLDHQAVDQHADAVAATAGSIDIALNAVSVMHDQGTLLADLVAAGRLHPTLGLVADWSQIGEVLTALEQRRLSGKAVLTISESGSVGIDAAIRVSGVFPC
jgi:NAD(P)-dependent dehydrogenase (short-subunit alcohol dehydrogenase family)